MSKNSNIAADLGPVLVDLLVLSETNSRAVIQTWDIWVLKRKCYDCAMLLTLQLNVYNTGHRDFEALVAKSISLVFVFPGKLEALKNLLLQ